MIYLVYGPSCAGKSTYVAEHAGSAPRFDFDRIAGTIAGEAETPQNYSDDVRAATLATRRGFMGWLLDEETETTEDVWVINARPSLATVDAVRTKGGRLVLIDPGREVCLQRAETDGRDSNTQDRINDWYDNPPEFEEDELKSMEPKTHTPGADKTVAVNLKEIDLEPGETPDDAGVFEGYAAVFNNVDSYGDVIRPGAFAKTIADFEQRDRVIPVLYGHDFNDPFSNIGAVEHVEEDSHGLKIRARLDIDQPKAAQVYRLMKQRRLNEMSFAFRVVNGAFIEMDSEEVYEIRELNLFEVSVVPIGANPKAEVTSVKNSVAHEVKNEYVGYGYGSNNRNLSVDVMEKTVAVMERAYYD